MPIGLNPAFNRSMPLSLRFAGEKPASQSERYQWLANAGDAIERSLVSRLDEPLTYGMTRRNVLALLLELTQEKQAWVDNIHAQRQADQDKLMAEYQRKKARAERSWLHHKIFGKPQKPVDYTPPLNPWLHINKITKSVAEKSDEAHAPLLQRAVEGLMNQMVREGLLVTQTYTGEMEEQILNGLFGGGAPAYMLTPLVMHMKDKILETPDA